MIRRCLNMYLMILTTLLIYILSSYDIPLESFVI